MEYCIYICTDFNAQRMLLGKRRIKKVQRNPHKTLNKGRLLEKWSSLYRVSVTFLVFVLAAQFAKTSSGCQPIDGSACRYPKDKILPAMARCDLLDMGFCAIQHAGCPCRETRNPANCSRGHVISYWLVWLCQLVKTTHHARRDEMNSPKP